jgi:hypothetical protein
MITENFTQAIVCLKSELTPNDLRMLKMRKLDELYMLAHFWKTQADLEICRRQRTGADEDRPYEHLI